MAQANSTTHPTNFQDLTGRTFGLLTVVEWAGSENWVSKWTCRCVCGRIRIVRAAKLNAGTTKGCGRCTKRRVGCTNPMYRHGMRNTPEYIAWRAMLSRCYNPRHRWFRRYGGRGITVCDRWRNDFAAFLEDMGRKPSAKHSIDRHPNNKDGNYEPGNCRWATSKQQQRNRRDNRLLTHNGNTATIAEWSESTGIPRDTLRKRLEAGWPVADALTKPVRDH